ncbi:hypothetical protein BDL97_01G154700 [Sphagnum fallax]|uniref:Uncharacterized protein n=1 Tax=Sphagnum jensenii TaxID=128206 RepID=A0ABP0VNJ5_9BRYO|nr:hypothetical protein BDL97_01G154700 [Sphagnum fallax]
MVCSLLSRGSSQGLKSYTHPAGPQPAATPPTPVVHNPGPATQTPTPYPPPPHDSQGHPN